MCVRCENAIEETCKEVQCDHYIVHEPCDELEDFCYLTDQPANCVEVNNA